jgi:hypothetical protein
MKRERVVCRITVWIVAGIMLAGVFPHPGVAQEARGESPPLTMEDLEVRGFREKPGQLYLSVPNPIFSPAPVRFDLLREDIAGPINPYEILEQSPGGENRKARENKKRGE